MKSYKTALLFRLSINNAENFLSFFHLEKCKKWRFNRKVLATCLFRLNLIKLKNI